MLGLGMLAALLGDWAMQPLPDNWRYMVGLPTVPALIMAGAVPALSRLSAGSMEAGDMQARPISGFLMK